MDITTRQLTPVFAGEVEGVDIARPLDTDEVAAIEAGMDRHAVLVFRGQKLDNDRQVAFSRNFGEIEQAVGNMVTKPEESRLPVDLVDVSNIGRNHEVLPRDDRQRLFNLGNQLWHTDSSFRVRPAKYSLLSARSIPENSPNTEFADMRAAYDALDGATKARIEDLVCHHSLLYSRGLLGFTDFTEEEKEMFRPVRQRLVRTHPVSGRKSLFLSSHIGTIEGWFTPEARVFIRDLTEHATRREFVHAHEWQVDDLVMWDNRTTMHRARPFDESRPRDVRRTTIAGEAETIEQAA